MQTAHHMLMFGCDDVDASDSSQHWECNEMGGICKGSVNKIMYAWGMDAPALNLPEGINTGNSDTKYDFLVFGSGCDFSVLRKRFLFRLINLILI